MNKVKILKGLSLVAALATGVAFFIAGDYSSGVGVIAAALSSASVFSTTEAAS